MKLNYPCGEDGLYILYKSDFDTIAEDLLKEYMPQALRTPQALRIDTLVRDCLFLDVRAQNLSLDGSIMGAMIFSDMRVPCYDHLYNRAEIEVPEGTMLIDSRLTSAEKKPVCRFTMGHECSHWVLHRKAYDPTHRNYELRRAGKPYIVCRTESSLEKNEKKFSKPEEWEEWQADALSAALLMPADVFGDAAKSIFRRHGCQGTFPIKNTKLQAVYETVREMSSLFGVSPSAVQIRLKHLNLLM